MSFLWESCVAYLEASLDAEDVNMFVRPVLVEECGGKMFLYVPNQIVKDKLEQSYLAVISEFLKEKTKTPLTLMVRVGVPGGSDVSPKQEVKPKRPAQRASLNPLFSIDNFVTGDSNKMAFAAANQVMKSPGGAYNPLLICGGVGLGKTHLAQAIGNEIAKSDPGISIIYCHSERFVTDMVKALQTNSMEKFKQKYRSGMLIIDDIQFLANKERSQEEFFHTFNALLDGNQQIVLTCDRYPREIEGLEERLLSRFSWGLMVAVDPPELETRVAILMSKAEQSKIHLTQEVAFFIAEHIKSNVRELEGALKRVIANSVFTGSPITMAFVKDTLRDLVQLHTRVVSIEQIQKVVANYYGIKISDMRSKRRTRMISRARQMAMYVAKEMTKKSYPEIGDWFGGKDHTTVIHAYRTIKNLIETDKDFEADWQSLYRLLG